MHKPIGLELGAKTCTANTKSAVNLYPAKLEKCFFFLSLFTLAIDLYKTFCVWYQFQFVSGTSVLSMDTYIQYNTWLPVAGIHVCSVVLAFLYIFDRFKRIVRCTDVSARASQQAKRACLRAKMFGNSHLYLHLSLSPYHRMRSIKRGPHCLFARKQNGYLLPWDFIWHFNNLFICFLPAFYRLHFPHKWNLEYFHSAAILGGPSKQ